MDCNSDISEDLAIQSAHIQYYCDLEGQYNCFGTSVA